MKRKKKKAAVLLLCMGLCLSGASAIAAWKKDGKTINILTMASYRTEIQEEYETPSAVYPGMSVDKKVNVRNSGTADTLIRVRFTKAFGDRREDGTFAEDMNLDPDQIEIVCNQRWWKYYGGYWYYREVLQGGETTAEPLFESFRVLETADNRYKGKDAEIVVFMESIQAEGDALSLWQISEKELGVSYALPAQEQDTSVEFRGQEEGFLFQGNGTDLFANFKNLLPGCTRTQNIHLKNTSSETLSFSLYAEPANQEKMDAETRKMVQKLLSEYAFIEIRMEDTVLYSGPVDGNPDQAGKRQTMGNSSPIDLGELNAKGQKELIVTLRLDPEMDTECQKLTGKVAWVFSASGEDMTKTSIAYVPQTGDRTPVLIFGGLCSVSGVVWAVLFLRKNTDGRKCRGCSGTLVERAADRGENEYD